VEFDAGWASAVSAALDVPIVVLLPEQTLPESILEKPWGLAFIDSHPDACRKNYAVALRNVADVIVLHDSDATWDHIYRYSEIAGLWKTSRNRTEIAPHTLVLSGAIRLCGL